MNQTLTKALAAAQLQLDEANAKANGGDAAARALLPGLAAVVEAKTREVIADSGSDVVTIPHDADAMTYRRLKALAEREGKRYVVEAAPPSPAGRSKPPTGSFVVSPGTSPEDYRALKASAEAAGKALAFVDAEGFLK